MSVFKVSYSANSGGGKSASFYCEFVDHLGVTRRVAGFHGKAETEELERKLQKLVDAKRLGERGDGTLMLWLESMPSALRERLAGFGLIDASRLAAGKTLTAHLDDFHAGLIADGTSAKHAALVKGRASRVLEAAKCRYWTDVTANRVQRAINDLCVDGGLSAQTQNFHLAAAKQFARWLLQERRITDNTLAHLSGRNVKEDRRHDRRALTADECRRLLQATAGQPARWNMTGAERALLYRVALETGLRANELRNLQKSGLSLGDHPSVTVGAGYTKNGKTATLPLRHETAALLRDFTACKLPNATVFNVPASDHTAKMLRADLDAAGIAYRDESKRVIDFHGLRHSFISALAQAGVTPAVAKELARHSTITLTMDKYTHVALESQTAALDRLPNLDLAPAQEKAVATGTDGKPMQAGMQELGDFRGCLVQHRALKSESFGALAASRAMPAMPLVEPGEPVLAGVESGGRGGIRTPGDLSATAVFKTAAIDHSATHPRSTS